jgi:hypothetical protein
LANPVNIDIGQSLLQSAPGTPVATVGPATGTLPSADQQNLGRRGVKVVVDITAISGVGASLTVKIRGRDLVSGKYYDILVSAALAAVATTVLTVYPGAPTSANVSANDVLPATWRIEAVVAGTTPSITATIGASEVV